MRFDVEKEPITEHKCCFLIKVNGYFGDGDHPYNLEKTYSVHDGDAVEAAMWQAAVFEKLCNSNMETKEEMEEWLDEQGYVDPGIKMWKYQVQIPVDPWSYTMLPVGIDDFDVYYFDANGLMYKANLKED